MTSTLCPYCGCELATDLARQCLSCGMDWHDPSSLVRRGQPTDLVARVKKMLAGYERGIYTSQEVLTSVIECATRENAEQIVSLLDDYFRNVLLERLHQSPVADDDWAQFRQFSIVSYCGPVAANDSEAEDQTRAEDRKSEYRTGIEALRQLFA